MQKLLIATKNPSKLFEIRKFLSGLPLKLVSLGDLGIDEDVDETGETYEENSLIKARFYSKKSGLPTISDDGGIEIEALNGGPGVRSRRFFGKNGREATDEAIIKEMKKLIKKIPDEKKGARFRTVVTLVLPNGKVFQKDGFVRGVLKDPLLNLLEGYPYRSFFFLPQIGKYYHESELPEKEMKKYNHRGKAIRKLIPVLKRELVL